MQPNSAYSISASVITLPAPNRLLHSPLADHLLNTQKIAYLLVDPDFNVIEHGGDQRLLKYEKSKSNLTLLDFIPELTGLEDVFEEILRGDIPNFELDNLNRDNDGTICYIDLNILVYQSDVNSTPLLLVVLTDNTTRTEIQQVLTQQRNELTLLKHRLDESNQRLEYLLQHYVPREVGRALMENKIRLKLGGEAREISILFADLRNFTSISEQQTPQQTIEMLHECLQIASKAIVDHDGVIVNYMGDAVMAIFNAPNELDDHACHAVTAGLALQARFDEVRQNLSYPVYFGVGVNTGEAIVGNVGAQWHYQYTAIGDTVNVASRLCSNAAAGEVLIGEKTHHAIAGRITTEDLVAMQVKGKSRPLKVFKVLN